VKGRRTIKIILRVFLAICLVFIALFFILSRVIRKNIRQQLTELSPAMQVRVSSIHPNIFSSSVSFDSLEINFTPYDERQQNKHVLLFPHTSLKGINFLKFLFGKKLAADRFILEDGNIHLDQFLLEKKDSAQLDVLKKMTWPFKNLFIRSIELKRTAVFLYTDKDQLLAKGEVTFKGLSVDKPGNKPVFSSIDLRLANLNYPSTNYKVQIQQLELNSDKKILSIDSISLISDVESSRANISTINITGFDVMRLLNDKILTAKKIVVDESKIVIGRKEGPKLQSLPFNLKKIHADAFQLRNSAISYHDKLAKCQLKANMELYQIDIHESFNKGNLHFGSVWASLTNIQYSADSYHQAEIKKINLDSEEEFIRLDELKITPKFGKYEFGRKLGHQADRVNAHVSKIEILKPDFQKLLDHKLIAEKILVGESKAYVFRDRRLPRLQKSLPLPVEYLKEIPFDIRVKTCNLAASTVEYEEYPRAGYGQTGILRIERARATISPLINHPVASDPEYINMNVVGSIMGSGIVHGIVLMPLSSNKPYRIKGAIERLELTKLNSSSENLGKIRIKTGFLDFLSFDFTMTNERSTGKIVGAYHHLIIQQLKKHTEEKNVADFASFMLRHLIIPLNKDRSLPERKRAGMVNYPRDPTRLMSHYFLQSLLMGVKKSFTLGFLLPK
jgi:hypothetical protein